MLTESKAERLREWRAGRGRAPFPEPLLLRDALYLLQGIDGRYVRFALAPAAESNPYLSEKGKEGDGTGFPLGKGVDTLSTEQQDIVGIDIVADEAKVGSPQGIELTAGGLHLTTNTECPRSTE